MKNCQRGERWVKLDTGVHRHIEYIEIAFSYWPDESFHMESTILRLIPKHEKRVIRILNLKIIYQIMIFSFDNLRKCNDYKR